MVNAKHRSSHRTSTMKAVNFAAFVLVVVAGIGFAFYWKVILQQHDVDEWQRMAGADAVTDVGQAINESDFRFLGVKVKGTLLVPGIKDTFLAEKYGVRSIQGEDSFQSLTPARKIQRRNVEKYMRRFNHAMLDHLNKVKPPT